MRQRTPSRGRAQAATEPCSNCRTEQAVSRVHCERCGVSSRPEPMVLYHPGKVTLDMIEGNWEEYHG